ncbi:MAG: hypothetical protein ACPGSD_00815 [Flavobacteriales bacterium]
MKRVIVDIKKVSKEVELEINNQYPYGYNYEDTITFKNTKGEWIRALRIALHDTVFLVKVSVTTQSNGINDFDSEDLGIE